MCRHRTLLPRWRQAEAPTLGGRDGCEPGRAVGIEQDWRTSWDAGPGTLEANSSLAAPLSVGPRRSMPGHVCPFEATSAAGQR